MPEQLIPSVRAALSGSCKLLIIIGERGRNRTFNLLIKSSRGSEEPDISSHREINDLPTTEPARKRFDLVLKRSTLAHIGPERTAHLRHTRTTTTCCSADTAFRRDKSLAPPRPRSHASFNTSREWGSASG